MRLQPNRNYVSNDDIQTPPELARHLVEHFHPTGLILEPCAGDGNFFRALRSHVRISKAKSRRSLGEGRPTRVVWCEVKKDRDFLAWDRPVDWIITNPPWSQVRTFLQHALSLADHVVFLFTINHLWTRARQHDIKTAGFGLKEIVMFDTPKNFPPMGFQLGAVYLCRGWTGPATITDWNVYASDRAKSAVKPSTIPRSRSSSAGATAEPSTDSTLAELRALNRHLDVLLAEAAKP